MTISKSVGQTVLTMVPLWITPNIITYSRALVGALALVLYTGGYVYAATALFAIAAVTDFLDGLVARGRNLCTDFGKRLDELVDKGLVVVTLVVFLALLDWSTWHGWVLLALLVVTLARDWLITWARAQGRLAHPGVLFSARVKTTLQLVSVGVLLFSHGNGLFLYLGIAGFATATVASVYSAYWYWRGVA